MRKDIRTIRKKNRKYQKLFDKYFRVRYILIGIILILLFSLYSDLFKVLILTSLFLPLAAYSMIATKFVPHIAVETLSGSVLLLGYLYGPMVALLFGLIGGFYGMYKSSHIKYLMILRVLITSITGFIMAFFTNISFNANFIIGIIGMNVVLFFLYLLVDPDPIQNYTHRASHIFSNIFLLRYLFLLLFNIIIKIG